MGKRTVTIRIAGFGHGADDAGVPLQAHRGDVVEVDDNDFERGSAIGAFEETWVSSSNDAGAVPDDIDVIGDFDLFSADVPAIADYIARNKPTIQELLDAVNGDVVVANRVLEAEGVVTGGDPRKGLVEGLAAVIGQG